MPTAITRMVVDYLEAAFSGVLGSIIRKIPFFMNISFRVRSAMLDTFFRVYNTVCVWGCLHRFESFI